MLTVSDEPILMFLALLALYSPLAALSSYMPIVGKLKPADQVKLAVGLFVNVAVFVMAAVWVGEPLLKLLGISTAALAATGGIALLYAGIPMMRGIDETVPEQQAKPVTDTEGESVLEDAGWRRSLFTPVTFPLTVGGTSFGLLVAFASSGETFLDGLYFSVAGLAYAVVTGITVYAAAHAHRHASAQARLILSRVAGILLTAIAVTLIANGGTHLVMDALNGLQRP
jgi:multiple antibiotic resistance protein